MLQSLNSSTTPMPPLLSLLSTAPGPYSSCGMENRMVIQPQSQESFSFDWSDFPVVCHNADVELFPAPRPVQDYFSCGSQTEISSSGSQQGSHTSQHESTMPQCSSDIKETKTHKKQVSFSSSLEIRTHSVVLGDHPFCHGLPLELGWEYNDTEYVSLDSNELNKPRFYSRKPVRLSFLERKNVLKRIGGMTERDLTDAMAGQAGGLRHAAPVSTKLSSMSS